MSSSAVPGSPDSIQHRPYPSVLLAVSFDGIGQTRLPEFFHSAGFRVALLCRAGLTVGTSRHVDEWIPVLGGTADDVARAISGRLDEFASQFDLVVPVDEPLLAALQRCGCADAFARRLPFFPDSAQLNVYLDNIQYLVEAREAGAPIPEFIICNSRQAAYAGADRLGYPVIIKQSVSMAGSGVKLAASQLELDNLVSDEGELPPFLVQRYVRGRVGGTTMLLDHGQPIRWFSFYKLFNWPRPFSPSGGGEVMCDAQVDSMVEILAPLHNFHGLCGIDWIRESATGRISLLEFNPRYTPTTYQGIRAGVDFAAAFRDWAAGRTPLPKCGASAGYTFAMFPEAAHRALDDRNPWLLLKSLADAPYSDPQLLAAHVRNLVRRHTPAIWKELLKQGR